MTINRVELLVRRRLVLVFIKADATWIELTRRQGRERTPAGGWVTVPSSSRPPQQVRIIPAKRRFDNGLVNAEAGQLPRSEYLLVGTHLLDVEVDDRFENEGATYQVTGILANREERTLCSLDYLGLANG